MLFAMWLVLVAVEGLPVRHFPVGLSAQLAVLAVVFAGYAISVRHELAGALLSLAGVAAFYAVTYVNLENTVGLAFAWFAAPPVLWLWSWRLARREHVAPQAPTDTPPSETV